MAGFQDPTFIIPTVPWPGGRTDDDNRVSSGGGFLPLTGGTIVGNLGVLGNYTSTGNITVSSGYIELIETSDAGNGANTARLFAQDDGCGKTQLMVRFGSGVAIEIKVEL